VGEPKGNSSSSSSYSKNKDLCPNGATTHEQSKAPNGFAVFWAAYPRKEGKGRAEKAWSKIAPRPDDVLLGLMLKKLEQAKQTRQWTKDGGEFIPLPASWLNDKGWEAEYRAPATVDFLHPKLAL